MLTAEQQAVFDELASKNIICIPSRKSMMSNDEIREKGRILKELVYMNLIDFDFSVANPNDETSETSLVYIARKVTRGVNA
jgi:hypothetical protein